VDARSYKLVSVQIAANSLIDTVCRGPYLVVNDSKGFFLFEGCGIEILAVQSCREKPPESTPELLTNESATASQHSS
jgi:hypothetical protein